MLEWVRTLAPPVLGLCGVLTVWLLTRRSTVVDRVANESAELKLGYVKAEQEFLNRLQERLEKAEEKIEELEAENVECQRAQDALRAELRVIREHCVRQGWPLPEAPETHHRAS